MKELLQNYSLEEIIGFLVVFALAIKGFVQFWDWVFDRLRQVFDKRYQSNEEKEKLEERLKQHEEKINKMNESQEHIKEQIAKTNDLIQLLIDSDKDDIKAWITKEHHYFCYDKKFIDDYSLDCLERRFKHYKDEGGNSFIEDLMKEIRNLPKVSTTRVEEEDK